MVSDKVWYRPFDLSIPIGTPYGVKGDKWKAGFHEGDDFLAPYGTPVKAADIGVVGFAGDGGDGWGNYVRLEHPDGTKSYYTHLSEIHVAIGNVAMRGLIIGRSGNSGNVWHSGHPVTAQERQDGIGSHCHVQARDQEGNSFKMIYEEKKRHEMA